MLNCDAPQNHPRDGIDTWQVEQARKSLLQSMLAQFRCGSWASPPQHLQGAAAVRSLPRSVEPSAKKAHFGSEKEWGKLKDM